MSDCIKRVGAILSAKEKTVKFFGYGCYIGDFVPIEAVGVFADVMKEAGYANPKILLDNGQVVYGCECWWGDEDSVKARIEAYIADGYTIVDITPDDTRKEFLKKE